MAYIQHYQTTKMTTRYSLLRRSGMASPTLAPSLFDGGTYFPEEETAPPGAPRSAVAAAAPPDESNIKRH